MKYFKGPPSMAGSELRGDQHQLTTHAHKGAAGKALENAHHTASPGAKRRQEERLRGSGSDGVGHAKRYKKWCVIAPSRRILEILSNECSYTTLLDIINV